MKNLTESNDIFKRFTDDKFVKITNAYQTSAEERYAYAAKVTNE